TPPRCEPHIPAPVNSVVNARGCPGMLRAPRPVMKKTAIVALLLAGPPAALAQAQAEAHWESAAPLAEACTEPVTGSEAVDDALVHPGLVRFGVKRAIARVVDRLFQRGYQMSTLAAELSADGTLIVRVDEGRIQALELRGLSPRIEGEVRRQLDLRPGAVFD